MTLKVGLSLMSSQFSGSAQKCTIVCLGIVNINKIKHSTYTHLMFKVANCSYLTFDFDNN